MKSKEMWLPVIGLDGIYEVSNTQKVRSVKRVVVRSNDTIQTFKQKDRSQYRMNKGYMAVSLCVKGISRMRLVHVLIAEAFIQNGKIPKGMTVNHIDGDKTNNNISNLEIVTYKRNAIHAHEIGLVTLLGEKHPLSTISNAQVAELRKRHAEGKSVIEIQEETGMNITTLRGILKNKSRKYDNVTTADLYQQFKKEGGEGKEIDNTKNDNNGQ